MMDPREFHGAVLVRSAQLLIGSDMSMAEARKRAIAELAAEGKIELKKHPRRAPPAPQPPPSDDLAGELVGAKERLFNKLQSYFSAFDRHAAEDRKRARDAKRAARIARKAAKAGPAPRNNVVQLPRPDAPQPDLPTPESTHPTAYLVYAGGPSGAVRVEDSHPSPATIGWRASIERNAEIERQRQQRSKPP
jgi:hypothetical protein